MTERMYDPTFQPPPAPKGPFLDCGFCTEPIEEGEPAIELYEGRIGKSKMAGHLMVVSSEMSADDKPVPLHLECVVGYVRGHICEPDYEIERSERYCDMCSAKMDGEYE